MIDVFLIATLAIITWCVASEGAWGAALILLSVVLSGLLAMNFFEPIAIFLEDNISNSNSWRYRWDFIALVGSFAAFVFLIRMVTEHLSPTYIRVQPLVHELVRWGSGFLTGYITMTFLLTALHTAPLPREFMGFSSEPIRRTGPLSSMAPDFQWLGFTQYVSENILVQPNSAGTGRVFDGPQFSLPPNQPEKIKLWPSFPIRYAFRREEFEKGGGTLATNQTVIQPVRKTPASKDF